MADNKLLLKRGGNEDFLAEDDPLAELARIVGFDQAPTVNAPVQRREPAFDLEDELLKELEIYARPSDAGLRVTDAEPAARAHEPRSEPAPQSGPDEAVAADAAPEEIPAVEPDVEEPAEEHSPVILEAVETYADASEGRVYERPASHPVFDLEDEILREFAAFDARSVTPHEDRSVEAEVVRQDTAGLSAVPVELHDAPDIRPAADMPVSQDHGRAIYDSFRADDLDAAISHAVAPGSEDAGTALASAPEVVADAVPSYPEEADGMPVGPVDDGYWADLGPDAGVAVEDAVEPVEPPAEEPVAYVPAHEQLPAEAVASTVAPQMAEPLESRVPQPPAGNYGLDELLAEVDKYPVGDRAGRWGVQSKPVAVDEAEKASAPIVRDAALPAGSDARTIEPSAQAPAIHAGEDQDLSFDDGSFEIDLGDIEIDLSDLDEADFAVSPEVLSEIAAVPVKQDESRPEQDRPEAEEPAWESAMHQPAREAEEADYSTLPFDPSQITPEEEAVEALAEMDVPDVPAVHEEEKPVQHPEYDIDLDAEMAQLFATATAPAVSHQKSGQTPDNVVAFGPAAKAPSALDLDEFERALEEDFRRSFTENGAGANPDRVALSPAHAVPPSGRSRRSVALMASAAVAIVLFGGAGVYAFMSGDSEILASSEPKVILADTDPVKIVPDDPGGKQVPNQNKAVYDRVAGSKPDETRQESLLTSNEEPVDVVQRTLMPENLPMDDDSMAAATPTGDTIDPRLLPDEAEQERVTTTNKVVSGVSPRKVKTMVVRPDGTLVEREVTEDDLQQQAANDAELMKIAQKAAQDAATASDSQGDDIAKAIESVPERLAPSDETAATPVEPADEKTARVTDADETPEATVAEIDPARIEPEQPAAIEQPADDAAQSVQETELKPAETAVDEKPVERSIAVDSQPVVADQEAVAAVAEAEVEDAPVRKVKTTKITPVPENRPVDQPVTVVGTVTDQGTVRSDADAKPQEVALADRAQAPAETTPLPAGSYVIQIASLPSEAEAQTSYSRLSTKFASIIGGRGVDIRKAEIKNKGTYYRVRIPAGTKQEAQSLCAEYKRAGGSCLVSK